jgi:hypothetical protein
LQKRKDKAVARNLEKPMHNKQFKATKAAVKKEKNYLVIKTQRLE